MLGWLRRKSESAREARGEVVLGAAPDTAPALPGANAFEPVTTSGMPLAAVGDESAQRAAELRRLAALLARGEAAYPYVVETAARICDTPLAGISLREGGVLRFKAVVGAPPADLRAANACRLAMQGAEAVTVLRGPDADERADAGAPTVDGRPLRFFAGARIDSADAADGAAQGVVWVADFAARELTPVQLRTLQLLARQTMLLMASEAPRY